MATPRDTGEVIGSRGTAATKDVQTSPTDTTAGALLNNETTHIGGNLNYTGANYQPESVSGLGVVREFVNIAATTIAIGASVSGSDLRFWNRDLSGTISLGGSVAGTWLNVGDVTIPQNRSSLFVRVA